MKVAGDTLGALTKKSGGVSAILNKQNNNRNKKKIKSECTMFFNALETSLNVTFTNVHFLLVFRTQVCIL